ncbi:hypothetical protein TIFTF001_039545 [Ficus carica]|uniref:Uncharacterized protein n=1 Tax=Ficus carica TaxID=3494 RepID=A0AA88EFB3_FICCA|nr:hypothetical protein TIFTF001_039545 [Ficus carica]
MDFPNPKDLLAKRKAAKEAAKAAAAASENVVKGNEPAPFPILETSSEPPAKPVSPPAKKRKAVEKARRIVSHVEVELPPRLSLLEDRKAGVELVGQLLSEVDADIMNKGRLQNHLDDLL